MNTPLTFNVLENRHFIELQCLILDEISRILSIPRIDDIDTFSKQFLARPELDLRHNREMATLVDNKLRLLLASIGIRSDFIQFPANIRILPSSTDPDYLTREYNVDSIHCDHWSGSPADSTNVYLYLRKTPESPELAFYTTLTHQRHLIETYSGPYSKAPKVDYTRIDSKSSEGIIHIFPCQVPHQILRNSSGVTISIDFRLRNRSPIFIQDLFGKTEVEWTTSKMTSLGVYWKWLDSYPISFREKVLHELSQSVDIGNKYKAIRQRYIASHYF
jgi:hypothetical protein